jgi:type I restriction enzyme S subunit
VITHLNFRKDVPIVNLEEVVIFLDNLRKPITEKDRIEGPYPYYGANGIQGYINEYIFDEELVLLAEDGGHFGDPDRGVAYKVSGKCWVNNHAHVLKTKPIIDINYLTRVLENLDLSTYINGTTRAKLTKGNAEKIKIPLPPLAEQQRIAAILDKAELVKCKRELAIEKLDSLAESIFLETFKESNNTLEVSLDEVLVGVKNCNPASLFGKSSFTYIDIGAVNNLSKAIVSPQVINGIDAPSRARQIILNGDVLISTVRPNLNCVALVDEDYINPVASTGFCVLRCNHEKILPEFLFLFVRSQRFIQNLVNQATGASYPAVSDKIIKSSKVNLPSIKLQTEFVKKIKKISSQKIKLKNQNRKLNSLSDSLQSKAFSGQL